MKTFSKIILVLILSSFFTTIYSQTQEILFPGLEGAILLENIQTEYKPNNVLNYEEAREYLYQVVYNVDDSVSCVYTGHSLFLPPNENNPIFHFAMFGSPNGIITEHTYPQSKGADEGNPRSDMHHLVPARLAANVARLNYPFGEIPDAETDIWLKDDGNFFSMPNSEIDEYSEQIIGRFEPKEVHKGNVARMLFYFYSMYKNEADAADPDFFELQRATMCDWHNEDPVDEDEYERTFLIAEKQDGKPNPFILDCTLATRIYCSNNQNVCEITSVNELLRKNDFEIFPNPVNEKVNLSFEILEKSQVGLSVFDALGRKVYSILDDNLVEGAYVYKFDVSQFQTQMLVVKLSIANSQNNFEINKKIIVD